MTDQTSRDKHRSNQRHWQAHVKALKQSGLSRAEYCRQYNLTYHAMTYWNRKFSRPKSSDATLVPVSIRHDIGKHLRQQQCRSALKVVLPGKLSVEVGDNFSPTTLTRLLTVLESR